MKECRCRCGGRRGSAMVQVLIVMVAVMVLSGSMVKLAAFSVRSAERRIRRAQCEVLAESVCEVLWEARGGSQGVEPELPEAGVYDLEIGDFPGKIVVECVWEDEDLENPCLFVRVTAAVREVSGTAAFRYVPGQESEEGHEDEDWEEAG